MELFEKFGSDYREVPNYWEGNCFGCSRTNKDGLHLPIYFSEKGCYSITSIPEKFCGFEGLVHGGIIATLLDEIAAWTIIIHLLKMGITQEVKIKYLKPVKTNTPIILEGTIVSQNKEKAIIKSFIKDKENNYLAECESKWFLPDFKTIEKITGKKASKIEEVLNKTINPIKEIIKK